MKIAVCSLSEFTYVAEFVDAAEELAKRHDLRYLPGYPSARAQELLADRGLACETLRADRPALVSPGAAGSTLDLFTGFFFRQAELVLPALVRRLESWKPDLVLSHLRDYGGLTAAEVLGIPVVSFGSHGCPVRREDLDPPFGAGISRGAPERERALMWRMHHEFNRRLDPHWNEMLRKPFGLEEAAGASTAVSDDLVILSMIPSLDNLNADPPPRVRYVGPLFSRTGIVPDAEERALLERIASGPRPRVFLSLGTTYGGDLLNRCLAAMDGFPGTVVASGTAADNGAPNRISTPFFRDVDAVLGAVDAVVTVSGGKTVLDALAHGKPMVCLPRQGEQREIALALVARGAAEMPCPARWDGPAFRAAVERVSETGGSSSRAAKELAKDVEAAGAGPMAAREIELLAAALGIR